MTSLIELDRRQSALAEELNHALVNDLVGAGSLTETAWRAAFEAVPRHIFAPKFRLPSNLGGTTHDGTDCARRDDWLRAVYQDEALLTEFDADGILSSSCSAPTVVAIMLERSGTTDGDTVLEIGTGTGWTAGLLAHRLGPDAVTSVDTNARCVTDARKRLARLDLRPALAVANGYLGHSANAPYDRVVATASVRQVPPGWLAQTRPGGTILTDLRGGLAGHLAVFTVDSDATAHGRFLADTVRFMPLRSAEQPFDLRPELSARAVNDDGRQHRTDLEPASLRGSAFGFFAQLALPGTTSGYTGIRGGPMYFCLTDPASLAWARVTEQQVTQGGGRLLWNELEAAHDQWCRLNRPSPQDFTITITRDGTQRITLPGTDRAWSLPL